VDRRGVGGAGTAVAAQGDFRIGNTLYSSLAMAVGAVGVDGTIYMQNDVTLTDYVQLGKAYKYTIDFGSYTLSSPTTALRIVKGNITLKNGTVKGGASAVWVAGWNGYDDARVNIISGNYIGGSGLDGAAVRCEIENSKVNITAGHFYQPPGGIAVLWGPPENYTIMGGSSANPANYHNAGVNEVTVSTHPINSTYHWVQAPELVQTSFTFDGTSRYVSLKTTSDLYRVTGNTPKTDAGNYTVTVSLVSSNDEWVGGDKTPRYLDWSINKASGLTATPEITILSTETSKMQFDLSTIGWNKPNPGNLTCIVNSITDNDKVLASAPTITEGKLLNYQGTGKSSGTAKLEIKVTSANYTDVNITLTFKATPTNFTRIGVGYVTLEEAVAGVSGSGQTIMMKNDVTLTKAVNLNIDKTYSISFNGYTLSSPAYALEITKGTVTLTDGTVKGGILVDGATVKIPTGTYSGVHAINCSNGCTALITTGTFSSTSGDKVFLADANSAISLASGSAANDEDYMNSTSSVKVGLPPVLSAGTAATRTNETTATISFSSNKSGTAYYLVLSSNAAAPTVAQVKAGTSIGAISAGTGGGRPVTLTSGAEPKDIYVVAVTADGIASNRIKISVPEYVAPTVTFDANGGSVTPPSVMTGGDGKLPSLPTLTRDGYTFNGWFTEKTGGSQVTTSRVFTANTTIYARWTLITYTITFNANSGTVSPTTGVTGVGGTLSSLPEPTRNNYTFNGWFTAASGGTRVTTEMVFSGNTTIYAQWTSVPVAGAYTITFNPNGGTVTPSSATTTTPPTPPSTD